MSDTIDQFKDTIAGAGLIPPEVIHADGKLHRFSASGKRGDDTGWYVLHLDDVPAGVFGCWRLGITEPWCGKPDTQLTHSEREAHRQRIKAMQAQREREQAERWERNRQRLRSNWEASHKLVMGDPVTLYLKRRGIGGMWPLPACLRYHQALPYWDDGEVLGTFPAMVARFHAADGRCVGLHQTYLTRDGRKADVPTPKKMSPTSGPLIGGCIPLAQPVDGCLGVAEGIETALCAGAGSGLPVVATYSASALGAYQWPKGLRRLVIFADNDVSGTGQAAARKLEARARASGLAVSVLIPQMPGEDWADVYARRDAATVEAVADSLERARFDDQEGGAA